MDGPHCRHSVTPNYREGDWDWPRARELLQHSRFRNGSPFHPESKSAQVLLVTVSLSNDAHIGDR